MWKKKTIVLLIVNSKRMEFLKPGVHGNNFYETQSIISGLIVNMSVQFEIVPSFGDGIVLILSEDP